MVTDSAVRQGYRAMISFGVAGGLASHLRAGDWVVASSIQESENVRATDAVWSRKLLGMISGLHPRPDCRRRCTGRRTGQGRGSCTEPPGRLPLIGDRIWRRGLPPSTIFPSPRCEWWSIRRTAGCRPPLLSACARMAAPMFPLYCATLLHGRRRFRRWRGLQSMPSPLAPRWRGCGVCSARISGWSITASHRLHRTHALTSSVRESTSRQARNRASNGASTRRALYLSAKNEVILAR